MIGFNFHFYFFFILCIGWAPLTTMLIMLLGYFYAAFLLDRLRHLRLASNTGLLKSIIQYSGNFLKKYTQVDKRMLVRNNKGIRPLYAKHKI
jgi:hypothetical protein